MIAGIIAAKNNNFGVVGVAPDAELYDIRILDGNIGFVEDLIEGIEWSIKNRMQIINISSTLLSDVPL